MLKGRGGWGGLCVRVCGGGGGGVYHVDQNIKIGKVVGHF